MIADAQHRMAQQFGRRRIVGEQRHHRMCAVIQRPRAQHVLHFIPLQQRFGRNVLLFRRRLLQQFAQAASAFQSQIKPVSGNGVHADSGIAYQHTALGLKMARVHAHQWVLVHAAGHLHLAQATL